MTYTYKCPNHFCPIESFDVERSIKDTHDEFCSKCGSKAERRFVPTNINLNFQGSYNNTRNK
jgi:predicted nucleic acid-binding Zn ribbon protein